MNVLYETIKGYKKYIGRKIRLKDKILIIDSISRDEKEPEFLVFNFNDKSHLKINKFKKEMLV